MMTEKQALVSKSLSEPLFEMKLDGQSQTTFPDIRCYQNAKCKEGKSCFEICVSSHCSNPGVVCGDEECCCHENHSYDSCCCSFTRPGKLMKLLLERKKIPCQEAIKFVERKFLELFDSLSDQMDRVIQQLNFLGLEDFDQTFLDFSNRQEFDKITGKLASQVFKNINQPKGALNQAEIDMDKATQKFTTLLQKVQSLFAHETPKLEELIRMKQVNEKISEKNIDSNELIPLSASNILKTEEQKLTFIKFFPKKLKGMKLLYRASENNFEISKFWERCNGYGHTVTLVKLENSMVIGGYTPLKWNVVVTKQYAVEKYEADERCQSFLFSLDKGAKFELTSLNRAYAVFNNHRYGPVFGLEKIDLMIGDRSDIFPGSSANFGAAYQNNSYPHRSKQTWKQTIGSSESTFFKTLEWQVFQVKF